MVGDYDNRLRRLEERAASVDHRDDLLLEECRKRTAELLNSKEVLEYRPSAEEERRSKEEWAAVEAALLAAAKLEQGKR